MTTQNDEMVSNNQNGTSMDSSSRSLMSLLYPSKSDGPYLNNVSAQDDTKCVLKRDSMECPQCSFTTRRKERLNRHMIDVHTSFKTFKCDVCIYVANSKINLEIHKKETHNNYNEISTLATKESSLTCPSDLKFPLTSTSSDERSVQSNSNTSLLECLSSETNINLNEVKSSAERSPRIDKEVIRSSNKRNRKKFCNIPSFNKSWTLRRVGYKQSPLVLDAKMSSLITGRSSKCNVVCKAEYISREHMELRTENSFSASGTWNIVDLNSSMGTFINGSQVPQNEEVSLEDGDLISIGGNFAEKDALGQKYIFLYKIKAPSET